LEIPQRFQLLFLTSTIEEKSAQRAKTQCKRNGVPNYNVGFGSCAAPLTNPRNAEGFVNGILFEVVGVTNSTS
jgi:hypothetical protein